MGVDSSTLTEALGVDVTEDFDFGVLRGGWLGWNCASMVGGTCNVTFLLGLAVLAVDLLADVGVAVIESFDAIYFFNYH